MTCRAPVESLESRRLLAVSLVGSELTISGTQLGDQIQLYRPKAALNFLRVSINGRTRNVPIANVSSVKIYGRKGNDDIRVSYRDWDTSRIATLIDGGGGRGTLVGSDGNDTIVGGSSGDSIVGNAGDDSMLGNAGNDLLMGGSGRDSLLCGDGDDSSDCVVGEDTFDGGNGLDRGASIVAPGAASKMVYSSKYQLLFLMNSGSAIKVVDLTTGIAIQTRLATGEFSDLDLTPSGEYLYASDYGGEVTGYSEPANPSYIHRFHLASRSWEGPSTITTAAWRIEAVDDSRVITMQGDQWVDMQLWRFSASASTELDSSGADYSGDIEYDHRTGRIFHGNSGISSAEVHVFKLTGDSFSAAESTPTYGELGGYSNGLVALSVDGSSFYYGDAQLESLDVNNITHKFSQEIVAADSHFAVSPSAVFDASSGDQIMDIGVDDGVVAMNPDGGSFYVYSGDKDRIYYFG